MTPYLQMQDIKKGFFGVPVLKGISLRVEPGQILALIGENGAGKSTLMNILGGLLQADEGKMLVQGREYRPQRAQDAEAAGIGFIHQELNLFPNLSIAENIFIAGFPGGRVINRREMLGRSRELLSRVNLGLDPDTRVERLAPGERQLVEIAKALNTRSNLIIFDEPTTSLTNRETERLFALMGRLKAEGPTAEFDIGRMITHMVGRELSSMYPAKTNAPTGTPLLSVQNLSQPGQVKDITFQVAQGEVVGFFGLMGSGRTELARMVFGLDPYREGQVQVGGADLPANDPTRSIRQGLAFVTEDRRDEGLLMDMSIFDNMALASLNQYQAGGIVQQPKLVQALRSLAESLRVKAAAPERQPVRSLSGGNQQKVVIGKWLATQPRLFILDEPTRGIDVGAKYDIYSLINDLATQGNGVLVISSELEELMGICGRIVVMAVGEIQAEFKGPNYVREDILRAAFREGTAKSPVQGAGA